MLKAKQNKFIYHLKSLFVIHFTYKKTLFTFQNDTVKMKNLRKKKQICQSFVHFHSTERGFKKDALFKTLLRKKKKERKKGLSVKNNKNIDSKLNTH